MAWSKSETELIEELVEKGLRGNDFLPYFPGRTQNQVWQKAARVIAAKGLPQSREDAKPSKTFTIAELPPGELSAEEIIAYKLKQFGVKETHDKATALIRAKINIDGAICIACFGDPHLDDDGCDFSKLTEDINVCKGKDYVFSLCVGDFTNNWVGRLQKLYANQTTTVTQSHVLIQWFFAELPWLLAIGGNHDHWSGALDRAADTARTMGIVYTMHGQRIALALPSGAEVRINARHDLKGHSQFHPTHGPMKSFFFKYRDHVAVAGHIHTSGYLTQKVAGIPVHAVRVGTYKRFDDYGKQNDFLDDSTPSFGIVINPRYTETDERFITVFTSLAQAVEYTEFLRQKSV